MKIIVSALLFLLLGHQESQIRSVYQGDTLVLKAKPGHRYVKAFGQELHYTDSRGFAYIGIPVDQTPATYLFDDKEIEIRAKAFTKQLWRVHPPTPKTKKRLTEEELIKEAFNSGNIEENWTESDEYHLPLLNEIYITEEFAPIHLGVDLRTKLSTADRKARVPVLAINSGVVATARKFSREGNMVILYHGLGIYSVYMHLSELKVREGQLVSSRHNIGVSGSTGHVLGPHLDFRVKIQGVYVDPLKFIEVVNSNNQNR